MKDLWMPLLRAMRIIYNTHTSEYFCILYMLQIFHCQANPTFAIDPNVQIMIIADSVCTNSCCWDQEQIIENKWCCQKINGVVVLLLFYFFRSYNRRSIVSIFWIKKIFLLFLISWFKAFHFTEIYYHGYLSLFTRKLLPLVANHVWEL